MFLHKIRTETLHQKRLTNKHERNPTLSSKYSKISFKQSAGSCRSILLLMFNKGNILKNRFKCVNYKNLLAPNKKNSLLFKSLLFKEVRVTIHKLCDQGAEDER